MTAAYIVVHQKKKGAAKIHRSDCTGCNQDKAGISDKTKWFTFESELEARRCAETLAPRDASVCRKCLGFYNVWHPNRPATGAARQE